MTILEKLLLVKEMNIYFKIYYKMVAVDLSKQQGLNADFKAIQQINFAANLQKRWKYKILFHS